MYVAIEGIDTAGKSTQLAILKEKFPESIFTKEPGGTSLGMELRELALSGKAKSKLAEMFIFIADRAEHIEEVIKANITNTIFSDRSIISGVAYASSLNLEKLLELNLIATQKILPSHIILLELSKEELTYRLTQKTNDAIELRGIEYLLNIQNRMKEIIKKLNINHIFIDASKSIEDIEKKIEDFLNE